MVHQRRDGAPEAPGESDEALTVLRGIWSAQAAPAADVEQRFAGNRPKTCKNMKNIGFGGLGADPVGGENGTNTPVDDDVRAEWRRQLARDGKLVPGAESVGDRLRTHGRG